MLFLVGSQDEMPQVAAQAMRADARHAQAVPEGLVMAFVI
jgi:hypothetical protein